MTLTAFQEELCATSRWDFSDLRALFVNCTLKPSPELSHTEGLMRISTAIMERNGVQVESVRAVDHDLAPGVWPDMRDHGAATDEWPELYERVQDADILVLGTGHTLPPRSRTSGAPCQTRRISQNAPQAATSARLRATGAFLAPPRMSPRSEWHEHRVCGATGTTGRGRRPLVRAGRFPPRRRQDHRLGTRD